MLNSWQQVGNGETNVASFFLSWSIHTVLSVTDNQACTGRPDCRAGWREMMLQASPGQKEQVNASIITLKELANRSEPKEKGSVWRSRPLSACKWNVKNTAWEISLKYPGDNNSSSLGGNTQGPVSVCPWPCDSAPITLPAVHSMKLVTHGWRKQPVLSAGL